MMIPISKELKEDFRNKWEAFQKSAKGLDQRLWETPHFFETLQWVFSLSEFVAKTCIRKPELLADLILNEDLHRRYAPETFFEKLDKTTSAVQEEIDLSRILRQFRQREMVRIAWRDLAGKSTLSETMRDLTFFAEAVINRSLEMLYHWQCERYGIPLSSEGRQQFLVVIGMGKLGAEELNFSSDIDLIFAYPEAGKTHGGKVIKTNDEFFGLLCRRLIGVLGAVSEDGPLFRVDVRLRPYGENGPIVMNFESMETYYESQGREWERYAWIKARCIAGDRNAGNRLLEVLKPFVYRRYLDYGTFESLRSMKQMIAFEVEKKGMQDNIKLGRGGIREIEFFGQAFQLIRGGVIPDLQEQKIQKVLKILVRENIISESTSKQLLSSYEFLRNVEHRLQEFSDRQTHQIPAAPTDRLRLALSMGFDRPEDFFQSLTATLELVHSHFTGLLEPVKGESATGLKGTNEKMLLKNLESLWLKISSEDHTKKVLAESGYRDTEKVLKALEYFRNASETRALSRTGRQRIDKLVPELLKAAGRSEYSELVLQRILDLIQSIQRRSCYIALLLENPDALTHLIHLAVASPWVISFIARHPPLLDELLDPRTLYVPPSRKELELEIRQKMAPLSDKDLEYQIETLCIIKQVNTLRVAAADVTGALPLMKVSDHLSYIAETVLNEVLDISWRYLSAKHGCPVCRLDNTVCDRGFAVVAYGKLGGLELGYSSDIDLVFLHSGTREQTQGSSKPIDSPQFFARLGQRVLNILTSHTRAGFLYEVDMRLRPSGSSGMLVSHIDAFADYQKNDAWTWEHQAMVRARAIAGDKTLMHCFEQTRKDILIRTRKRKKLRDEVCNMRERMRQEHLKFAADKFDLKQGLGGMVDIEFIVQYLALLHAHEYPQIIRWSDNVRILNALNQTGVIDDQTAHVLRDGYLTYRATAHRLSLQNKTAIVAKNRFLKLQQTIIKIWQRFLGL
ncbi:MAG: bifunctional [glutamate--ammonia ligase]-adenylyl-L-tyrosine phosphorylase/[glutamate--ammonia-ligase] adenylyltransferase [Desulfobacterales bacterium]